VKVVYHADYHKLIRQRYYLAGEEKKLISEKEINHYTLTASNSYNDKGELCLDFFLPSMWRYKQPLRTVREITQVLNSLFLTEFLCAFVRVENERQHPECATPDVMYPENLHIGCIWNCPFYDLDIGDFE
jgi:hypothetical protein